MPADSISTVSFISREYLPKFCLTTSVTQNMEFCMQLRRIAVAQFFSFLEIFFPIKEIAHCHMSHADQVAPCHHKASSFYFPLFFLFPFLYACLESIGLLPSLPGFSPLKLGSYFLHWLGLLFLHPSILTAHHFGRNIWRKTWHRFLNKILLQESVISSSI